MRNLFRKLISVLLIVACAFINTSAFAESNLTIHFLDVGQGAAAIIRCDGEVMMFDGGSAGNSSFIYSYLQNTLGIEHIDVMVASHPHEDHIGGLSGALNACSVGTIYSPVTEYDSKQFSSLLKYAGKQGLSLTVPAVGDTFTVGSAVATFLSPAKAYEYRYLTLEAAQRFMGIEKLHCSLWSCKADGTKKRLDVKIAS